VVGVTEVVAVDMVTVVDMVEDDLEATVVVVVVVVVGMVVDAVTAAVEDTRVDIKVVAGASVPDTGKEEEEEDRVAAALV